jgi:hypothetical protein
LYIWLHVFVHLDFMWMKLNILLESIINL